MRKLILFFIIALMVLAGAGKAPASTSSAAVLFLRIAAGARAAGMGEAFVAIADDATATHWNPAGLGNYPLSSKWFDVDVPDQYQPLGKIALYKNDGSDIDYNRYDIWALSPRGLIRCSKGKWRQGDIIQTTPDQTAESILRQYTGLVGDAADKKLPLLMENIGRINNAYPRERIDSLKNVVMETLSAKYTGQSDLENLFIALDKAYNQCRVDWEMFNKAAELSRNALRDSVIDELEADKILFAVEKSRRRVLAPQMVIPYEINFSGRLHDIAADDDYLWVAAETGLYRYSGKNWQRLPVAEKGIAVDNIRMIKLAAKRAYLGTDTGLFVYDQGAFKYYGMAAGLPEQAVQAITVSGENNIWAIIGTDLYHFDGSSWRNYFFYNDVLGETDSSIYESMKIYGTADEREQYLTKLKALNPSRPDSIGPVKKSSSEVTPLGTTALGREIKIPYMARMKYEVTDIGLDSHGGLWIGTQYGLLRFNGREWNRLGYKEYTSTNDISIYELALTRLKGDSARAERLAENLKAVNEIRSDTIKAGQTVMMYVNPAGARINEIHLIGRRLYFATEAGTIYFDGAWTRYNEESLGRKNTTDIEEQANNAWFVAGDKIAIKAGARGDIALMHVNWLPELVNDIYYEFASYVRNVEGVGTLGGNITFLSYGKINRTGQSGEDLGEFSAFDMALTLSYGSALTSSMSGGLSIKLIYSHLSSIGTAKEKGNGTSTGLALDAGILYKIQRRLNLGVAVTNIGPNVSYIDVEQADPLPRNLAVGLAWKMVESPYNKALVTIEANKSLVAMGGGVSQELKEVILNGGVEYSYGSFISFRTGYIYDQEGEIKTPTLGFGVAYGSFHFDFAYIPSNDQVPLANTMRFSLSINR